MRASKDGREPAPWADPLPSQSLQIGVLERLYATGGLRPEEVVAAVFRRIRAAGTVPIWIALRDEAEVLADLAASRLRVAGGQALPLFGVPFAVKDNIDVAGMPTTAACPGAAYTPAESAAVVEALIAAGALLIGKTNLDQFATGLVGTRSPYGVCANAFDPAYVSGGSSSGSALAVALGQVSFALGTDTAGSGRVPAGFNNIVGLKPSVGSWSTRGVLPACRSIDCVSVFSLSCDDAGRVHAVLDGCDPEHAISRPVRGPRFLARDPAEGFRFGVPARARRGFFGDTEYERLYDVALERLVALGGEPVEIDIAPFFAAGDLLYGGAFVAERWAAVGRFVEAGVDGLDPTVRAILSDSRAFSAAQAFEAQYVLAALKRAAAWELAQLDFLALPTTGTIPTIGAVAEQPLTRNAELGRYTSFGNLLDLCAIAVPAGFRIDGLPFGMQFIAPPLLEHDLLFLADRFHRAQDLPAGATALALDPDGVVPRPLPERRIVVVGAHLSGQPLNGQLTDRGARLVWAARTSPDYRLYALAGTVPPKPGLVRVARGGASIAVEVWALSTAVFGEFIALVPAPLAIGTVELEDGSAEKGFLVEPWALTGARDITDYGGWRAYLAEAGDG